MPWVLIPFAVFIVCALSQFWFVRRVRQALIERHPELWLEMSYKAWFLDNEMYRFAFSRRLKDLDDPVLDERVRAVRILLAIALAAWMAIAMMAATGIAFKL